MLVVRLSPCLVVGHPLETVFAIPTGEESVSTALSLDAVWVQLGGVLVRKLGLEAIRT